jgi:hypothetical protein
VAQNYVPVIVRVEKRQMLAVSQVRRSLSGYDFARTSIRFGEHNSRAVTPGAEHFHPGYIRGHNNSDWDAEDLARTSQSLGKVS